MPPSYRQVIDDNPFFVIDGEYGIPVASGFLSFSEQSVEAVFSLPEHSGKGLHNITDLLFGRFHRKFLI